MTKKIIILFVHIGEAVFLGYLSYMILNKKQIPNFIGIFLGFAAMAVVAAYIYFYIAKNSTISNYSDRNSQEHGLRDSRVKSRDSIFSDESTKKRLRGFLVDPNDPRSKPVGGFGGVGWV